MKWTRNKKIRCGVCVFCNCEKSECRNQPPRFIDDAHHAIWPIINKKTDACGAFIYVDGAEALHIVDSID